jgi:hypothetical protein
MNSKALAFYGLSLISLFIALVLFFKSLDWKAIVILLLGMASVVLFRLGIEESKKKKQE